MSESSGWAVLELETGSQRFEMEKYEGIGGSRDHDETSRKSIRGSASGKRRAGEMRSVGDERGSWEVESVVYKC